MSAPLKRKIALLEALLAEEKEAHKKTFAAMGQFLHEKVIVDMRNKAALEALVGEDYFGGPIA